MFVEVWAKLLLFMFLANDHFCRVSSQSSLLNEKSDNELKLGAKHKPLIFTLHLGEKLQLGDYLKIMLEIISSKWAPFCLNGVNRTSQHVTKKERMQKTKEEIH